MLSKVIISSNESVKLAVWQIQDFIKVKPCIGLVIMGSNERIYLGSCNYIPQLFNSSQVFISSDSFQQNNIKLVNVRKFVSHQIKLFNLNKLMCIGGESYLYGLTCGINQIYHMTNSNSIYSDCEFNKQFFKSIVSSNLVNYNLVKEINSDYKVGIINLANLNFNLLNKINISKLENIIIINCHHEDFWKKIKLLSNFKIKSRHYFVCNIIKYFITVTILYKVKLF